MKKLLFTIIAVSLVSLTACQSVEIPTIQVTKEKETATPIAKNEAPVTPIHATGEETKTDAGLVTIKSVERVQAGEYDNIKAGNDIVLVTVEIINDQDKQIDYNPFNFQMVNSKGQVSDFAISVTSNNDTALNSGKLQPGGTVEGTIAYEQPKDENDLKLAVKKNMFSNEATYIELK